MSSLIQAPFWSPHSVSCLFYRSLQFSPQPVPLCHQHPPFVFSSQACTSTRTRTLSPGLPMLRIIFPLVAVVILFDFRTLFVNQLKSTGGSRIFCLGRDGVFL